MDDRQAAIMRKILTATADSTKAALVREYARIEAEIAVDALDADVEMSAADEWGRPRCQEIIRYVDTYQRVQCGMTEDHDGDCDPLPEHPSNQEVDQILAGAYVTVTPVDAGNLAQQLAAPGTITFTTCKTCTTEYNGARYSGCPECNATIPSRLVPPTPRVV